MRSMTVHNGGMLLLLMLLTPILLVGCGEGGEDTAALEDSEVAIRVNDETMSRSEFNQQLNQRMQSFRRRMGDTGTGELSGPLKRMRGQMKRQLANQMVQRLLIQSHMNEAGVTVSDSEVQARWEEMTQRFPSQRSLKQALRQQNTSETEVQSRIRKQLRMQKFLDQEVGMISVSETEARQHFRQNRGEYDRPEQVRTRHILVKDDTGAQEKIGQAQREIEEGMEFEEAARKYSEGPSATKGGDLGYISRDQVVGKFADAAFALKPGNVSDPVKTRFGYHLIKVEEHRDTKTAKYRDVSDTIIETVREQKKRQKWQQLLQRLREQSTVEINVLQDTRPRRRGPRGMGQGRRAPRGQQGQQRRAPAPGR